MHCFVSDFFSAFKHHYLESSLLRISCIAPKSSFLRDLKAPCRQAPIVKAVGADKASGALGKRRPPSRHASPGHCPNPSSSDNLLFHFYVALYNRPETVLQKLSWREFCCTGKSRDLWFGKPSSEARMCQAGSHLSPARWGRRAEVPGQL